MAQGGLRGERHVSSQQRVNFFIGNEPLMEPQSCN